MLSCSGIKLKLHVGGGCFLVLVCFDGGWDWSLWQWRLGIGLLGNDSLGFVDMALAVMKTTRM